MFINTVENNKSYFQRGEMKVANTERIVQELVVWPSTQALKEAVWENQIINCPITMYNINKVEAIYRP